MEIEQKRYREQIIKSLKASLHFSLSSYLTVNIFPNKLIFPLVVISTERIISLVGISVDFERRKLVSDYHSMRIVRCIALRNETLH